MRAEEDRTIWMTCHCLDGMWGPQGKPQDTRDGVIDVHGTIVTGSSDLGSTPATDGSHTREASVSACDGSYNESPILGASIELGDSIFLREGHGEKHR